MGVGPIPVSKMREYGVRAGLDSAMMDAFLHLLRRLDRKYVDWQEAESEKKRRAGTPRFNTPDSL